MLSFTIVGFPPDVREVYLGDNGILKGAKSGSIIVDMTTTEPSLAQEIYAEAKEQNVSSVDAPVSGGDVGAREARLSIMVGGDDAAVPSDYAVILCYGKKHCSSRWCWGRSTHQNVQSDYDFRHNDWCM